MILVRSFRWLALTISLGGCASSRGPVARSASGPDVSQPEPPASTFPGPVCTADGPSVEAVPIGFSAAKPPVEAFLFDARVRNPLPQPIWLIFNLEDGFATSVNAVTLALTETPRRYVWSFYGRGSMKAVRVAAHADIVIRRLEYFTSSDQQQVPLVLATELTVGGRPAIVWIGRHDEPPARGEVNMESRRVDSSWVTPETFLPVRVGTICSYQVQLRGEIEKRGL